MEYDTGEPCVLYRVDVNSKGFFSDSHAIVAEHGEEEEIWQTLITEEVCTFWSSRATFLFMPFR
jgi:hypothetical protein